jgi:ribosome maturation protein Sdo1
MNMDKIHVEVINSRRGTQYKFYEKGKPTKAPKNSHHEEAFKYVQKFYIDAGFDYPNIKDHKRFVVNILTKLENSIKLKLNKIETEGEVPVTTPEQIQQALEVMMENLPKWWRDTGNITLPTINKSYAKIIQQIKNEAGTTDSYAKESQSTSTEDYEKFVQQ